MLSINSLNVRIKQKVNQHSCKEVDNYKLWKIGIKIWLKNRMKYLTFLRISDLKKISREAKYAKLPRVIWDTHIFKFFEFLLVKICPYLNRNYKIAKVLFLFLLYYQINKVFWSNLPLDLVGKKVWLKSIVQFMYGIFHKNLLLSI